MKITDYLKETKAEMKHVNWPTRKQSVAFTSIVVGLTLAFAALLGIFDYIFGLGLETLIS